MLEDIIKEAEKYVKKYTDEYEIYLNQSQILELNSENNDLSFAKEEI